MNEKYTLLYDTKDIFDEREKFLLRNLKVVLMSDLKLLERKDLEKYNMLIILESDNLSKGENINQKGFDRAHISIIRISQVPKADVFELIINIINTQIDFNELTHISNEKIIEALLYIDNNLQNSDLNLKSVSNYVYLNTSYFSRFFKGSMGIGFNDYIIQLRISKAKQMLANGHLVTDVCMAIGYTNVSYFSQIFKKRVGVTPSKFRKRYYSINKEENNV
ncbi:helix-turn-helix domain-containing protein [Virgibacillus pantothenticus]|uniref:helix-turn-helix domain-containing protein n=1 Tax=Virgibacillus pantothenticus TaxID=1473 RepID=UPI0025B06422|nr:AraC family transcriptional regulator [Virgibacillus pantothenticus]